MSVFALWIPILVAAVFVFVASSVIHMVLQVHNSDYSKMPDEDKVLDVMRGADVARGTYMFPCATTFAEFQTPEMQEKLARGPVGFMTVVPNGPPQMGKALGQWFVFCIVVGVFVAYVAGMGLAAGADFMTVFRFTATVSFLGYGFTQVLDSIWKGVPWGITAKFLLDGLIYALATGAAFGWLWPAG